MNVLSIQSEVVFGHVGNSAARFALQRLGHEVWAVPTVLLSSHAGYATVGGEPVSADLLGRLVGGLDGNGWLKSCDAVISGYLGHREHAGVVADAVRRAKAGNPACVYCLDPVFGDDGRAYARPGVAEAMARELLPLADIVTPNAFELSGLTSTAIRGVDDALAGARKLGRPVVVVTSVPVADTHIGTLVVHQDDVWLATTPRLENPPHGAGDLFAALFVHYIRSNDPHNALVQSVASLFHVLASSAGELEMRLVALQAALADPPAVASLELRKLA